MEHKHHQFAKLVPLLLLAALLALAGLAVLAVSAASASSSGDRKPGKRAMRQLQGVNFISGCNFSHRAPDDPIVFSGQPGKSHDHSFVGNTSTNASSTVASLQAAGTTCQRRGDTAGYWMPTLLVNGEAVAPLGATIYYRRRTLDRLQPFPSGLKIVAGDAAARTPQDRRITFWSCGPLSSMGPSSEVPSCEAGRRTGLRLHVRFPNCWDGTNLDSSDHKSHMAYAERGRCPATHPVAVPALAVIFRYPVAGGPGVELASGGQYSGHADFFNAWNQGALTGLVNRCLNALRHCGRGF